ncbi:tRNA (adenosine(37)-N6)-threonylcarbamoyltransferase complex dimerization subunit type 1 TsaB [Candidatus Acetothermia bacterium]|jgi:tRNA threonylcarbamoyl adenosine modification protein YeaZ|nr:tRNA (adenosine(37)-N6)-threonylcarbamoyltransferase complex dimerization subunit type 1 TsaB [Candidatus Acetothermia bacterium]MCI2431421.1 tRNA (adenosine(37)-N6)-threonylcarbamoyltransferase complex dimerization subunit type 1 TsaB [Candidatus Acetothermia bacterium]MCI2436188.1 tRNA (adenosine(37)-N6)-threonylcarbamoyltransferase complex dimerization subunit type 1 TsaB [Candidatus Acetothermia bacterium]
MIALGIETSHEQGSVGLAHSERILGEVLFSATLGPGEQLFAAIENLLRLNQTERDQLSLISVALGPGSFTSLRIGISVAKGLAQTLGLPLVGVPTADAYAAKVLFWTEPVCVVLKDRRDLVYRAFYAQQNQIIEEGSLSLGSLLDELKQRTGRILSLGSGAEHHRSLLESAALVAPSILNQPSGALIARLGIRRFLSDPRDKLWELEPLYRQRLLAESATS